MSTPLFALLFCSSIRSKSLNNVRMSSRVVNASFQAQKLRICNAQSTHNPLFFSDLPAAAAAHSQQQPTQEVREQYESFYFTQDLYTSFDSNEIFWYTSNQHSFRSCFHYAHYIKNLILYTLSNFKYLDKKHTILSRLQAAINYRPNSNEGHRAENTVSMISLYINC